MTARRSTLSIGKQGELRVIGELLRQGFMVYVPIVDIEGTDCIIRNRDTYIGVQVKTRESAKTLLFDVKRFKPTPNLFHHLPLPEGAE